MQINQENQHQKYWSTDMWKLGFENYIYVFEINYTILNEESATL